jgi:GT2 family glycosyltransferase/glycosyltransferase involved in cell wall biosynthesis
MPGSHAQGEARAASDFGCAALQAGQRQEAARWLDRAHRLAPDDLSVAFMLATALIGIDDERGHALLTRLVADHPGFRDAHIALAAAERRKGDHEAAGRRLSGLLSRGAPPRDAAFRRLADAIARDAGTPGWIAATGSGAVIVSAPGQLPVLRLDEAALPHAIGRSGKLPPAWRQAARLVAMASGKSLLGSPVDLAALRRVEGFVERSADGDITGWAWLPGDPDAVPDIVVQTQHSGTIRTMRLRAKDETLTATARFGAVRPRGFRIAARLIGGSGDVRAMGGDGRDLAGSPLRDGDERRAARDAASVLARGAEPADPSCDFPRDAWRPLPVTVAPPPGAASSRAIPPRRSIDIVIPVFQGAEDFVACLASLRRDLPAGARIVVIDDASPDAGLRGAVDAAVMRGEVVLVRHHANRGFPGAANSGFRHAHAADDGPRDILLLNADTLVPAGAVGRLADAAYGAGDIASVTPMSDDGTIVSYPGGGASAASRGRKPASVAGTDRLDDLARAANGRGAIDLPTAVGFCMFIRHDSLAETGLFREDAFAQGYGEENDWCLRARHLGWRHVAATGVFVAHLGGRSFGLLKSHLLDRNLAVLNRLHPGYDTLVAAFIARDPLASARRRMAERGWRAGRRRAGAVVVITHDLGGGVGRHVAARGVAIRAEGLRPIVLRPATGNDGALACLVGDGSDDETPDLRFSMPMEMAALARLLRPDRPVRVEIHHLLGHAPEIAGLAGLLGVPCDVVVHDYGLWCPRVTLCGRGGGYCGEPSRIDECEACVADLGGRTGEEIGVAGLRARSAAMLRAARRVVVSCDDAATRLRRHVPLLRPVVSPWEDPIPAHAGHWPPTPADGEALRIVVPGAIGPEKGYDVLLACARDAVRRDLAVFFVVVGHTVDDARLMATGTVFVTGRYDEAEAVDLIRRQDAHLAFIPSVWPETWCYALSNAWRAGLPAAAFALGAQGERIARAGTGGVLPLGLPPARVNDWLIGLCRAGGTRTAPVSPARVSNA